MEKHILNYPKKDEKIYLFDNVMCDKFSRDNFTDEEYNEWLQRWIDIKNKL